MEKNIVFEKYLFGDNGEANTNDEDFIVDRIIMLPRFRPLHLDTAIELGVQYCKNPVILHKLLAKTLECPVLIYKLYKRGLFQFNEINHFFKQIHSFILGYYFRREIKDFDSFIKYQVKPSDIDFSFFEDENCIDQLIDYGFFPSSIEYCIKYDDIDVLRHHDISNYKEAKWSPFEWSCKPLSFDLLSFSGFYGSLKCFKQLLMNGSQISADFVTSVYCSGSLDLFQYCIDHKPISPLNICKAAEFCQLSLLVFCYENAVDLNQMSDIGSALHLAAINGHLCIVEFLVSHSVDINSKKKNGNTPLHYAAHNDHLSVVEYLVSHGAEINSKNCWNDTPLHYSTHRGNMIIVQYLVNNGADINAINKAKQTPLHKASNNHNLIIVEYLIFHGADVNARDENVMN